MTQFRDSIANLEMAINVLEAYLVENTQPRPLHEVERELLAYTQRIGRAALERYVASLGTGEVGTHLDESRRWRYHGVRQRTYRSIFGPVPVRRAYYHHSEEGGICPLDAALQMPERSYSYLLQGMVLKLAAQNAYEEGHDTLHELLGVTVPKAIAEKLVVEASADAPAFQRVQGVPEGEGEVVVIQADGKGIPMVRAAQPEAGPKMRRKKGEKRNKKKMATIFTISSLAPEPETEPLALNRKTYGTLGTKRQAFERFAEIAAARVAGKKLLFLSDADPDLAALQREFFPEAESCVDWIHVVERLWTAAYVFHPEGSPAAQEWVRAREGRLLNDEAGTVIRGLKQSLTKRSELTPTKRATLRTVIGYLEGIRDRIPYKSFWHKGYPIATGSVEGGCRHLICDRMERTGMHWKETGAQAMLHVRSIHINGDARDFEEFRIRREQERLYGNQAAILKAA